VNVELIVAAVVGAMFGFGADRLSARWPAHEDGAVRAIDWRTLVVTLAGAASFAALLARYNEPADIAILGIYFAALIVLLGTDLDQRLLPDVITLPLIPYAALVLVLGLNPVLADKGSPIISGVIAGLATPAILFITDRIFKGALGMGDLKLAISLGLMFGVSQLFVGFLLATIVFAGVVVILVFSRRVSMKTAIPFGPALIGAGILAGLIQL
jgi:leader peptidase (prepilin peptidase)/N-methyltransferase